MHLDIFTWLVYTSFLLTMIMLFSRMAKESKNLQSNAGNTALVRNWIVVMYTFFVGLRFKVGLDYEAYMNWYQDLQVSGRLPEAKEFGYVFLNQLLVAVDAHYVVLFIIIAIIQILLIYACLKKFSLISPWYIFFLFTTLLIISNMNLMRQTIAYFSFFLAINYYLERRWLRTFIALLLGFSFHKSIIFGAIFLPFLHFDWFKNRNLQLILLTVTTVFSTSIFSVFLKIISPIAALLGYGYYLENLDLMYEITREGSVSGQNVGKYLFYLINILVVLNSERLKIKFKNWDLSSYYNLFFLGALLDPLLSGNFILARTNEYLMNFRVLIYAALFSYLYSIRSQRQLVPPLIITVAVALIAYFYRALYVSAAKSSPFTFIFE